MMEFGYDCVGEWIGLIIGGFGGEVDVFGGGGFDVGRVV